MSEQFRASMNWLHIWGGLVIGAALFAIFWMGTLTVFDREIDRWMMPDTRRPASSVVSFDTAAHTIEALAGKRELKRWGLQAPTDRVPTMRAYLDGEEERETLHLDPASGTVVAEERTYGASGFFFPFHFTLMIDFWRIGEWLVGLAAVTMMAMCVSGVVIHKRIFIDFFLFRIVRKPQRTTLDLHNITGVLGLPFNFLIAFSGLVIFMSVYLPAVQTIMYPGDKGGFGKEAFGNYSRPAADSPGELASLDAMADEATRRWGGDRPANMQVRNPGDANAFVTFYRPYADRVTMNSDPVVFDGTTGRVLAAPPPHLPVITGQKFISGMHFIQFRHWTLRWLYFLFGLAGCTLIATGFLFWVQSRAKRHAKEGVRGMALVRGLSVGATTGMILATLSFLVANRALPDVAQIFGVPRADVEVRLFFLVWLLSFIHAWVRPRSAWLEQSLAIALAAISAAILNWLTTGDTITQSMSADQWGVAGVDFMLLFGGGLAFYAARRLATRAKGHPRAALRLVKWFPQNDL